jgi:hypothetical protein
MRYASGASPVIRHDAARGDGLPGSNRIDNGGEAKEGKVISERSPFLPYGIYLSSVQQTPAMET